MMAVIDAQLAWWPPTFSPSALSRMWLAWWIVQDFQRVEIGGRGLQHQQAISRATGLRETLWTERMFANVRSDGAETTWSKARWSSALQPSWRARVGTRVKFRNSIAECGAQEGACRKDFWC